jgi:hypothetical protein
VVRDPAAGDGPRIAAYSYSDQPRLDCWNEKPLAVSRYVGIQFTTP